MTVAIIFIFLLATSIAVAYAFKSFSAFFLTFYGIIVSISTISDIFSGRPINYGIVICGVILCGISLAFVSFANYLTKLENAGYSQITRI